MRRIGIEDYLNLPLKLRGGVTVAVVMAAVGAMYLLSYAPKIREIDSTFKKIEQLRGEIDRIAGDAQKFAATSEEAREAREKVEAEVKQLVPQSEDSLQLLYQISLIAGNKARFNTYHPTQGSRPEAPKKVVRKPVGTITEQVAGGEEVKVFLVRLSLVTEYKKLPDLLEQIHKINRLVEVESLKISRQQPGVLVDLTLRAYYSG